ncbi:xanthine dehydrogenase family protein molybdopterin-binding subunit [Pyxidicoccus fallax]|uniref:Xanthine dehydrogenase family protein molybdopterin-binding subunit n=1 Tax=Pyxidicoccus fallax TaxID=394095 RepID=A0A848L8M4_9BACT|nr:molybdopterin cofactor-binding domain-containing protein [Pyxidicoccus fallax]NMO15350.1 xanthine dehydrogenase family protein molybdopterin-binding subunit [Pyxidicoccus fallax]NPC77270.1 xanthine dehydrogenase family protein molybdopterin-binding subunit [Pyxidicoccus fallax]
MSTPVDRRTVLKGSLVLAFSLMGPHALGAAPRPGGLPRSLRAHPRLDAWLEISADGVVTLKTGKVELGQGVLTALGQICADELDVDFSRLTLVSGDTVRSPDEGTTAGSMSMPESGTAVRHAAAEARALLLEMAGQHLGVKASRLRVKDGLITAPGGRSVTYWSLMGGKSLNREATGTVSPKPPGERRYIGRPVPRVDLPAKVMGEPVFVQDFRSDTLVHGRVVRAPSPGASLVEVDTARVEGLPGVLKVVRDGDFLAVIATREWLAIKAAASLAETARWREQEALPVDVHAWLLEQPTQDTVIEDTPRPTDEASARTVEARYRRPYQMHGAIGPSCAVAEWDGDVLTVHSHSQSIFDTTEAIARMLRLPTDKVHGRHLQGSGCYGHNGADDAAADAALLAHALPGRAVRVQWSREDEHACEPYGSAMVMKVRAGVSDRGDVLDWDYELWSMPHGTRPGGNPGNLLAGRSRASPFRMPVPRNGGPPSYAADRNAIPLYAFPGRKVTTHFVPRMPLRVSSMRALGAYGNVFAIESFMDELAHAAGADPVDFRLRQLQDARARAVILKAAERFGWSPAPRPPGRGRGIGFARYKNLASYCAVCVEVSVDPKTRAVRVLRAVLAADAGEVVNPDGLVNQLEGGLIQSLSWSLKEAVRYDARRVLSRDWSTYPILTFSEVPPVDVALIDRPGEPFLGAGEAAQGPTAAALANAVFDATGVRVRDLPLTPERLAASGKQG